MTSLYVREITREEHLAHLRRSPDASHLQIPEWGGVKPDWLPESIGWFEGEPSGEATGVAAAGAPDDAMVAAARLHQRRHQLARQLLHVRLEALHRARSERLRHQAADAGVVRRFQVQHAVVVEGVERLVFRRGRGAAEVLVGETVLVGAAEAAVAQQRRDVRVVRDQPLVRGFVVHDPAPGPQFGVRGVRVREERRVPGVESEVGSSCHAWTLARVTPI